MNLFSFSSADLDLITKFCEDKKIDLQKENDLRKIAESILKTSDFFIQNPLGQTPWHLPETQMAYIFYFSPLNSVRMSRVISAQAGALAEMQIQKITDFGAGLGSGGRTLQAAVPNSSLQVVERSDIPIDLLRKYQNWSGNHEIEISKDSHRQTLVCSYSLTELQDLPSWIFEFENVIILEPATQADGRRLMAWRDQFLKKGFFIWGPCTHAEACPLLTESKTDWCHDRVHLQAPDWFLKIESFLPMKNRTLTTSYLIVSKKKPPQKNKQVARITGDLLKEKGKDRQLVCRSSKREFLAWLHKNGPHPEYFRGDLIILPEGLKEVSNELRFP